MNAQQDFAHWQHAVGTVDNFHREMAQRPGLEFVLAHDPEKENTMIEPPPGSGAPKGQLVRSNLFVIRKQQRLGDLKSTVPMAVYWCLNERIFQAPSVGNVLNARIVGMGAGLGRVLDKLSLLDEQAAQTGAKKKSMTLADSLRNTASKEGTPIPGSSQPLGAPDQTLPSLDVDPAKKHDDDEDDDGGFNTLEQALRMTLRYGKDTEEETLVGEPGNFRLSKAKELPSQAGASQTTSSQQARASSRGVTPAQSRAVSTTVGAR